MESSVFPRAKKMNTSPETHDHYHHLCFMSQWAFRAADASERRSRDLWRWRKEEKCPRCSWEVIQPWVAKVSKKLPLASAPPGSLQQSKLKQSDLDEQANMLAATAREILEQFGFPHTGPENRFGPTPLKITGSDWSWKSGQPSSH